MPSHYMKVSSQLQRDFAVIRLLTLVCSLIPEGAGLLPRHSLGCTTVSLNPRLWCGAEGKQAGCSSAPLGMEGLTTQVLTFVTQAFSTVLGTQLVLTKHQLHKRLGYTTQSCKTPPHCSAASTLFRFQLKYQKHHSCHTEDSVSFYLCPF